MLSILSSGAYCASFKTHPSQPEKCSTFFPTAIKTVEELDQVIQESSPVCAKANRSLRRHSSGMWIEVLRKKDYYNSVFPLFFVGTYERKVEYPIVLGKKSVPYDVIYTAAYGLIERYVDNHGLENLQNPIRYIEVKDQRNTNLFIDVAPAFPEFGVPQGIIFIFDRGLFDNDESIDKIISEV